MIYIISYLVFGFITYGIIRALKPDKYREEWLKVMTNTANISKPLSPGFCQVSYSAGLIAVFPMSLWEYFIKREKIEPERFDHKRKKIAFLGNGRKRKK